MSCESWTPGKPPSEGNPSEPVDPRRVSIEHKPVVVGLPFGWHVEYAGQSRSGDPFQFAIVRPQIRWSYADFVCLIKGPSDPHFRRVPILGVTRWRDGGTTEVKTAEGEFFFHSPAKLREGLLPTFRGEPVTLHDRVQGACG